MDTAVAATERRPQNRRGVVAGYLLLGSYIVTVLALALGLVLASRETGDTALAWMPLILPTLATVIAAPMLVVGTVFAIRGAVRERTGRIACIVVAVVSGILALLLLPVAVNALFAMLGMLGAFG